MSWPDTCHRLADFVHHGGSTGGRSTSLQRRLVRPAGGFVKHARYYWLLLAEGHPGW